MKKTWEIVDHLCLKCGGRILKCVTGNGMTPGGNPTYRCADCGVSSTNLGGKDICWCGMKHRNQSLSPYQCLPFSILEDKPEFLPKFLQCGCDPSRGEVGVVLRDGLK